MARFRYRLQSVLNIRLQQEEQQKNVFAEAQMHLREEEEKLEALNLQKAGFEEKQRQLGSSGALDVQALRENHHNIEVMEELIRAQRVSILRAQKVVEVERERLTEAMQERKIHERLREKAFEAYQKEELREEARINDERSGFVYGQKTGDTV